jgi:hypothetical protein
MADSRKPTSSTKAINASINPLSTLAYIYSPLQNNPLTHNIKRTAAQLQPLARPIYPAFIYLARLAQEYQNTELKNQLAHNPSLCTSLTATYSSRTTHFHSIFYLLNSSILKNPNFALAPSLNCDNTSRSKHLAHKVWVSVFQTVELLPGGVIGQLSLPSNQDFDERTIVLQSRVAAQHFNGYRLENPLGVDWRQLRQCYSG